MSDVTRDTPSPWTLARRLAGDEEASAAVEFIVLIPVYLLLLSALFMFANVSLIRQALVQATRFQAWSSKDPNSYVGFQTGSSFFGPYSGTFKPKDREQEDVTLSATKVSESDLRFQGTEQNVAGGAPPNARSRYIAVDALNNLSDVPHVRINAEAEFEYDGLRVFGFGTITQSTQCAVLLAKDVQRPEFKEGDQGDPHPVLKWTMDGGTASKDSGSYFDPTKPENMPLNPLYDSGEGEFTEDGGAPNSGIWNRGARIGGDQDTEWDYYEEKPKR